MERTLKAAGYSTIRAASGLEGVEVSRRDDPDMIVVSGPLQDLDVHTLTLRLRGLPGLRHKPIVVVDDSEDSQNALAVGATGTLPRGASPAAVVRKVASFLRGESERPDESSEIRLRSFSERMAENLESQIRLLQRANEELEYLARIRSELLRNVSHELATPITPALGYVQMLRTESLGPVTDLQRLALESLSAALGRLEHVTTVLREVSALEQNQIRPRLSTYTLSDFTRRFAETWNARGEHLITELLGDDDLIGDTTLLARALDRVVENARKFAGPDGTIAMGLAVEDDVVTVTVVDSGPGIAPEHLARLGDLFHQVDGSATRKHGGIGLGLAYARRVVEAHGGTLTIHSPPRGPVAGMLLGGTEVTLRWLGRIDARSSAT